MVCPQRYCRSCCSRPSVKPHSQHKQMHQMQHPGCPAVSCARQRLTIVCGVSGECWEHQHAASLPVCSAAARHAPLTAQSSPLQPPPSAADTCQGSHTTAAPLAPPAAAVALSLPSTPLLAARSAARRKHKQWKQQKRAEKAWQGQTDKPAVRYEVTTPLPDPFITASPPAFFDPEPLAVQQQQEQENLAGLLPLPNQQQAGRGQAGSGRGVQRRQAGSGAAAAAGPGELAGEGGSFCVSQAPEGAGSPCNKLFFSWGVLD